MKALEEDVPKSPLLFSQRWILAVLALLGNIFVYVVRVNLSVAILCMVRSEVTSNVTSYSPNVTESVIESDDGCGDLLGVVAGGPTNDRGEFTWDKSTQSRLLSMYFYGYIFTQIPGGWLASRYGGKRVWGTCMLISALCTLATPITVRTNLHLAFALRFLLGFSAGVTFPCVHALLGRWAPPFERSKMGSYTFAGPLIGNIVTFSISGYMCEYGFDNGWGSIFYLAGIFNLIWVIAWFLFTADSPELHKRISQKELQYIKHSIGMGNVAKVRRVPWLKMFKSGPLWAIIITHFGNNYTNYTLLTSLPTFMKEALKFDIKQNGVLSALPYVSQVIFSVVAGFSADAIRERRWLTTKTVRKIFQSISLFGMAVCIIVVGQMNCSQRYLAVFVLCLCTACLSCNRAGYTVNHLDLAPSYSGILFGISNTAATIPGMIAPTIAGALTPNKSAEEWRNVFYVCAAVAVVTGVLYLWLADGELQRWANPDFFKNADVEITYRAAEEPLDDVKKSFSHDGSQTNPKKLMDEAKESLLQDDLQNVLDKQVTTSGGSIPHDETQNVFDKPLNEATKSPLQENVRDNLDNPMEEANEVLIHDMSKNNLDKPISDVMESLNQDGSQDNQDKPIEEGKESLNQDDSQDNQDKPIEEGKESLNQDGSQDNQDKPMEEAKELLNQDDSQDNQNKPMEEGKESLNQDGSQDNQDKPMEEGKESLNQDGSQDSKDKPIEEGNESLNQDSSQDNQGKPIEEGKESFIHDGSQTNPCKPIGVVGESLNQYDSQNNLVEYISDAKKPPIQNTGSTNPHDSESNVDQPIDDVKESTNPHGSQSSLDKPVDDIKESTNPHGSQSSLDKPVDDIKESTNPHGSQSSLDKPVDDVKESTNPHGSQSSLDKPVDDIKESTNPHGSQSSFDKPVDDVKESTNPHGSQSSLDKPVNDVTESTNPDG